MSNPLTKFIVKPISQFFTKLGQSGTKKVGEKVAVEGLEDLGKIGGKSAGKEAAAKAATEGGKKAGAKVTEQTAKEVAEETTKAASKKAATEGGKKATVEATEKGTEKIVQEEGRKIALQSGKSGWATFGNLAMKGSKGVAKGAFNGAKFISQHPMLSLKMGATGYAAWQLGENKKPVFDSLREFSGMVVGALFGEERKRIWMNTGKDFISRIKNVGNNIREWSDDVVDATKESVGKIKDASGEVVGNFHGSASGMSDGNSVSTLGNFLGHVTSGHISGLSVVGMLLSAYMLFGRTGILGKVGGLLLGMLALSSSLSPSVSQSQPLQQSPSQDVSRGMHV